MKGVIKFEKDGKFSIRCVGPVETTKRVGRSENELYPIRFQKTFLSSNKRSLHLGLGLRKNKCSFIAGLGLRTTPSTWHFRLGHTSPVIVSLLLINFHLPLN